ncbi:MAG: hypothetical protein LAN64_01760 [Acidobacteriia bacterium]|nr:hypothetical protein [Terriglobia bacterium]
MNPQTTVTFSQLITPYLPLVTPPTLLILAWRARGFFDRLVNNHLAHFKQDIITEVQKGVDLETQGHKEIVEAVNAGTNRVVDTLITLRK